MAKKRYQSPVLMSGLTPGEDPIIDFGGSQGTSGEDSQFTWDPAIDPDEIDLFWSNCDETDLDEIDTDDDLFISAAEFAAWEKPY